MKRISNLLLITTCLIMLSATGVTAEDVRIDLKQNATIKDILTAQTGKRVAVRIDSGEEIEGTVVAVGDGLVHIAKLTGKDFYDAVLRIDRISSVRIKIRER